MTGSVRLLEPPRVLTELSVLWLASLLMQGFARQSVTETCLESEKPFFFVFYLQSIRQFFRGALVFGHLQFSSDKDNRHYLRHTCIVLFCRIIISPFWDRMHLWAHEQPGCAVPLPVADLPWDVH